VASRQVIGHFIPSAIFAALSGAMPGRLMAPGADPIWLSVWRGQDPPFTLTIFQVGGTGARPTKDGLNAVGFPSGVAGVPAEVIESLSPVVLRRRQLRPDSGGAGQWRGGLGQLTEFARRGGGRWSVSSIADRTEYAAPGLLSGGAGAKGEVVLGDGTRLHAKAMVDLKAGDVVHVNLPGGGGYGSALERAPAKVLWDVIEGYVTPEEAEKSYGVMVRYIGKSNALVKLPRDWEIDAEETARMREKMKGENGKRKMEG
jgi:N-methylhydantoinase B